MYDGHKHSEQLMKTLQLGQTIFILLRFFNQFQYYYYLKLTHIWWWWWYNKQYKIVYPLHNLKYVFLKLFAMFRQLCLKILLLFVENNALFNIESAKHIYYQWVASAWTFPKKIILNNLFFKCIHPLNFHIRFYILESAHRSHTFVLCVKCQQFWHLCCWHLNQMFEYSSWIKYDYCHYFPSFTNLPL